MKYFVILLVLLGTINLELIRPAFAHSVHCGIQGCRVGAFGITDWYLAQKAFDSMFYLSIAIYGIIVILFWFSLLKRKSLSRIVRK
jgi:hypothetical protein